MNRTIKRASSVLVGAAFLAAFAADAREPARRGEKWFPGVIQTNLVANKAEFGAQILEPNLQNAWGIAIRPAGLGGHFWVAANTTHQSHEYVGDVGGTPLFQDDLKVVDTIGTTTGVVFNGGTQFVITQAHSSGSITAPARFIFANDSGTITAWTERQRADGGFDRPADSVVVVDGAALGSAFFGAGIAPAGDRLYAADFGAQPALRVYDSKFQEAGTFTNPFQAGEQLVPGEYAPFNVQTIGKPGHESVFVMYAKTQPDPENPDGFFAGEEEAGPGLGRLAEFSPDGTLRAVWRGRGLLNAPWGIALAPNDFGLYSGCLLVGNFGDGTIVALHPRSKVALDYVRDARGRIVVIDGLWGLQFGNGASLGEANHMYFAAGPNEEVDGIFGKLEANSHARPALRKTSLCR